MPPALPLVPSPVLPGSVHSHFRFFDDQSSCSLHRKPEDRTPVPAVLRPLIGAWRRPDLVSICYTDTSGRMRGNTCGLGSTPAVRGCGTGGVVWAEWEAAGALPVRLSLVSIVPASDHVEAGGPGGLPRRRADGVLERLSYVLC